jgi:sensor domain CHASE-containing protein
MGDCNVSPAFKTWGYSMTGASDIPKNRMSGFIGRLLAPVALATMLLLAAVLTLIWVAARGQDDVAAQSSSELLNAVLLNMRTDLGQLVYAYAWWDNAVENLIESPDREWADTNIGIHAA